jgi:hypothetical protein
MKDTPLKVATTGVGRRDLAELQRVQRRRLRNVTERGVRMTHDRFQAGKPLIFGKDRNRGIRPKGTRLAVVEFDPESAR